MAAGEHQYLLVARSLVQGIEHALDPVVVGINQGIVADDRAARPSRAKWREGKPRHIASLEIGDGVRPVRDGSIEERVFFRTAGQRVGSASPIEPVIATRTVEGVGEIVAGRAVVTTASHEYLGGHRTVETGNDLLLDTVVGPPDDDQGAVVAQVDRRNCWLDALALLTMNSPPTFWSLAS